MPPRTVDAPPKRAAHAAEGRHRPIIILTARASESSKIEGIETGADDYLIKPFSATELRARVKNLIELRRLLRQRFSGATVIKPSEVSATDVNERGWAGGDGSARQAAMRALANDYPEEPMATDGISYLDIHDNWTLADRYALIEDHDGLEGVDLAAVRIAAGLLLTSAGPLVIHGGTEMLRSKGLAPHEELEVELANGPIRFKGRDDTYNLRAPNRFLWEHLAPSPEHAAMRGYWRGLLALRMSDYGRVFRVAEVPDGHYRWITPDESTLLGYVVGGRVLVLANSGEREGGFRFDLPHGDWRQVGDRERVDLDGVDGEYACLSGGRREVRVPGGAFLV